MPVCIRCGGCCKATPCWFAQINYDITEENKKPCPALTQNEDGTYTCMRMFFSETMRHEMLRTGCHYPEYRRADLNPIYDKYWDLFAIPENRNPAWRD